MNTIRKYLAWLVCWALAEQFNDIDAQIDSLSLRIDEIETQGYHHEISELKDEINRLSERLEG